MSKVFIYDGATGQSVVRDATPEEQAKLDRNESEAAANALLEANAQARAARHAAFVAEADPLFMQWQAGEGTEEEWLSKREEIRNRHPYVEVPE